MRARECIGFGKWTKKTRREKWKKRRKENNRKMKCDALRENGKNHGGAVSTGWVCCVCVTCLDSDDGVYRHSLIYIYIYASNIFLRPERAQAHIFALVHLQYYRREFSAHRRNTIVRFVLFFFCMLHDLIFSKKPRCSYGMRACLEYVRSKYFTIYQYIGNDWVKVYTRNEHCAARFRRSGARRGAATPFGLDWRRRAAVIITARCRAVATGSGAARRSGRRAHSYYLQRMK